MKRILIVCLLVLLTGLLFGGDIAAFVNLGFSENSRYLMFGQYGVLEESMQLYADLYTVEVRTNRFVPNGVKNSIFNESLSPGQSGIGALFSLYRSSETIVQQYRINHMKAGRLLYILVNGDIEEALATFVYEDSSHQTARRVVRTLKEAIPKQLIEIRIQGVLGYQKQQGNQQTGGKVIASERISPLRKDVTAKLYGGDVTRKRKLLEKQKKGKKKMRSLGKVDIPPKAYLSVLKGR